MTEKIYPIQKTETQWLKELGEEKYQILRKKGTERPFTGVYNLHKEKGIYQCAACKTELFVSDAKFDSGCGWPSFDQAIEGTVTYIKDKTFGMVRTEILCATCGSHLGHVFNDGPTATGQRYCINSLSLDFKE
ncbi:MAG: peptide-methionine (R)-S-oxide reductase [Flavobacteriaceae bacterium CG_4_8_14_3_um_filter_34_10]|nr:peptide-methionine (R)-S-oxide reductase MsrB [Flavobacteriia bacterium]OIP49116.1 MAG: peptide-methionine (R)-S-oxide reductase [Flavobacteriaceae bacterium CG2_30_34_30]PIQ19595.1 MAG: peptide-methionine (R)-S-oxide reductase [Flavobacteriaceae bacterium CG18_big_fil_WC_8_21_14_2_50_34_36]PIV49999.1 MAG: peptide-methionine (R)-S-oxide reductase [Flavobacteriaceae bacterium CG02_land_8_20_14_3_00_34_13]PIX10177.1 MAG: peptide-methionine (R)-S-oxide reductase [Flavobacteriaceae bacterium CG_